MAGQQDFAGAGLVEAGEQAEQGGFARAGAADDGQAVAAAELQGKIVEDGQLAFRAVDHFAKVLRG
ncbi:hypothetical protein D3C86_2087980 [compost metagenome]